MDEDDLMPLSALQHLVFCERQCALIHVEGVWVDNSLTIEGSHLHERVHQEASARELRDDRIIARRVWLRSFRLGVSGIADVVEFLRSPADVPTASASASTKLPDTDGRWIPQPVEYKRGKPKSDRCDEVQLCAQAMCLEEMLGVEISRGAIYYGRPQRRSRVEFSAELRSLTEATAKRLHHLVMERITPRVPRTPKCKRCSLLDVCRPKVTGSQQSARAYLTRAIRASLEEP